MVFRAFILFIAFYVALVLSRLSTPDSSPRHPAQKASAAAALQTFVLFATSSFENFILQTQLDTNMLPFSLGYLQQQCAPPAPVDWEAAAKQYCAYRAPQSQPQSQSEQQQQQRPEDYGGKRKRATKGFKEMPHETAETDDVTPPDTPEDYQTLAYRCGEDGVPGDNIGFLLKRADQAPYSYEALHDLVCALSAAGPERLEDYESALERLLDEYPLLFGYWKKLARLQCQLKGDWTKCDEVFERCLEFVGHNPLVWTAYLEWVRDFASLPPNLIRARMDQAIQQAGAHWKAWPLWQNILDWEEGELFAAREKVIAAEQGAGALEAQEDQTDNASNSDSPPLSGFSSLVEINREQMLTALQRLRLLYSQLLRTPLECSDLVWERLKALVERGSSSSIKSRRGPRPGVHADGDGSIKGASTLFDVYDLLADELLPELLQRLRQQKSSTLEELQLSPERAGAEQQPKSDDPAAARAAIKERVSTLASVNAVERECWQLMRENLDATLEMAALRQPFEKAVHRWFWHPDPLAPRRLQAWRDYLDFEEKNAPERLPMLQRRCLEVCASYPEFWLRCARQRRRSNQEEALQLLHFATTKVLKRRRDMACIYASQLEACGRLKEAANEFEALVRPPVDPASLKYFVALLQFSLRHPPETAADSLSHALLLLEEAAEKYRDDGPCAELLHIYRAKLVAFHGGDTKKALSILSRARDALPRSLPLLLLQLRLLQQQHAGDPVKILAACRPILAEVLSNPDSDVWLRWQVLKLQIHLYEFYAAPTETLFAAKEAATTFLERHRQEIASLAASAELRRLPQKMLLPYGDKEEEGAAAATGASAASWSNEDPQANAEAWQQQAYQQQLQQQYAALGFDCSQLYNCYNGAMQQQQQHMMMAAAYGHQQPMDSTSTLGGWTTSSAAAAAAASTSASAASCLSGSTL